MSQRQDKGVVAAQQQQGGATGPKWQNSGNGTAKATMDRSGVVSRAADLLPLGLGSMDPSPQGLGKQYLVFVGT
uniref:Uncharacterized protein n=1 Tax=Oryza sativa subsp. japonica TaxID=39947 RepID=Q69U82_ORYSJ|nr:hypothetical protein [Oryza sativa Japonica Group]